jgi:pimeloyl-ACP methyl ester carboxylesterase
LADAGFATIRADKRGVGASGGDGNDVTLDDYVADCAAWLTRTPYLAGNFETDAVIPLDLPLYLIGHSEGGLIALNAANTSKISGVVLLCCPGRRVDAVFMDKLSNNQAAPHLIDQARQVLNLLSQGTSVDTAKLPPLLGSLFHASVQRFWMSLLKDDPADLAAAVSCPILIIGGGQDLQVPALDAARLAARAKQPKMHILPEMNHVLTDVSSKELQDNLATYTTPTLPLSAKLLPLIAQFILERP